MLRLTYFVSSSAHTYGDDISPEEAIRIAANLQAILERYAVARWPEIAFQFPVAAFPECISHQWSVEPTASGANLSPAEVAEIAREITALLQFACESQAVLFEAPNLDALLEDFVGVRNDLVPPQS